MAKLCAHICAIKKNLLVKLVPKLNSKLAPIDIYIEQIDFLLFFYSWSTLNIARRTKPISIPIIFIESQICSTATT